MTVRRHCTCKSEVQIPLNLTGEAGDLYYNSTGFPSSLDTPPPPPSLFTSSSIISLILKHLITLFHPSPSPESSALSSVQTIHSFFFRNCLTVRASFYLSISHISVTAIIPHVGKKNLGVGLGGMTVLLRNSMIINICTVVSKSQNP